MRARVTNFGKARRVPTHEGDLFFGPNDSMELTDRQTIEEIRPYAGFQIEILADEGQAPPPDKPRA